MDAYRIVSTDCCWLSDVTRHQDFTPEPKRIA